MASSNADGFYDLPTGEPRRDIAEADSKHRSAFRKREALRQEATQRLLLALGGAAEATLPAWGHVRNRAPPGASAAWV